MDPRSFQSGAEPGDLGDGCDGMSPVGYRGKALSPGGGLQTKSPEAEAKCKISVHFKQRFPVEKLGFNEYKQYSCANTHIKRNSELSTEGVEPPLWVRQW